MATNTNYLLSLLIIMGAISLSGCDAINNFNPTPTPVINQSQTTISNFTNTTPIIPVGPSLTPGALNIFIANDYYVFLKDDISYQIDGGNSINLMKGLNKNISRIIVSSNTDKKIGMLSLLLIKYNPDIVYETGIPIESVNYNLYKKTFNKTIVTMNNPMTDYFNEVFITYQIPYTNLEGFLPAPSQNSIVIRLISGNTSITFLNGCNQECLNKISLEQTTILLARPEGQCENLTQEQTLKLNPGMYQGDYCNETKEWFNVLGATEIPISSQLIIYNDSISKRVI